jgi:DNA-binding response OmpR family regulator
MSGKKLPVNKFIIFLIEDSELYSLMLDHEFRNLSQFRMYTYTTAEEAIKDLYLDPDIIILDYYLPGMNGLDALKKIKSYKKEVPVIVLSSQDDVQVALDVIDAGAHDYMIKKIFSVNKLYDITNKIMGEKNLQQDNLILNLVMNKKLFYLSFFLMILVFIIIYNME